MKILGIHYGHNATAALLVDGKVVFCQSEERMNGLKNSTGFPEKTLEYIKKTYGGDFNLAVFPQSGNAGYEYLKKQATPAVRYQNYFRTVRPLNLLFTVKYTLATYLPRLTAWYLRRKTRRYDKKIESNNELTVERNEFFANKIGIPAEQLRFIDHHESHAYSLGFLLDQKKKHLIFTLDGEGDDTCATVSLWENGSCTELSRTQKFNSIGYYYLEMTGFLGMKPNEDEFKLMGLAPYAKQESEQVKKIVEQLSAYMQITPDGNFTSSLPPGMLRYAFQKDFSYLRFDQLAAGMQQFLEKIVLEWITYWIKKTGVHDLGLSGGVFMNVKLNQRVLDLPEVSSVVAMPSAADESTVFGCIYKGFRSLSPEKTPTKITDLYLGTKVSKQELDTYLKEHPELSKKYRIQKEKNISEIAAKILAKGGIVARCSGRMEWGARGLGNRSIIADPRNRDAVRIINEMIKNRDFWMPFAPSVLEEDMPRYFTHAKQVFSPYMVFSYAATSEAVRDLPAALHQYDFTGRPQAVRKSWNPEYHALISHFRKLTGVGAVLNTSFNLHGYPVARTFEDAFIVMENSKLPNLIIDDYLISRP